MHFVWCEALVCESVLLRNATRTFDPLHGDSEAIIQKVIFMSHKKAK